YFISRENVTVKFTAPCVKIRLKRQFYLGRDNRFNPDSSEVIIYTKEDVKIWDRSVVIADIYTMKELEVEEGTPLVPTVMIGFFIANNIIGEEYSQWYTNPACECRLMPAPKLTLNDDDNDKQIPSVAETNAVWMKAYPNPFREKLHIEFTLAEDSKATLELFNISGQRIARLFDGTVKASEKQSLEYSPRRVSTGIIIYRLKTEQGIYHGKAVMMR
ncbi:MAG TPA: T9SS type A sorting domain-containing protein, partial [Chitinophagales bacterium]|nr:T9SS type A sorting domain-containing protein [Chitinophagales bacterium]